MIDEVKRELIRSLQEINVSINDELGQREDQAKSHKEAILVIQDYKKIIRSKKKGILYVAFSQERIFRRFKDSERFREMIKELVVNRSTVLL